MQRAAHNTTYELPTVKPMNTTIAVLQVETQRDTIPSRNQSEVTELFKVEQPAMVDTATDDVGIALFQYDNRGYAYLEALNTDDTDTAIDRAKTRIEDYCEAVDASIIDITVKRRD
ncbi:hypothetical protein [Salinibaculum rarum]|uniref:hypothetical protein n=1 Tax=Salinibaculum rarum TaxID=3058903 RepID=UPI00265FB174|nr:hypothetical protein [Salinibaculum sp. KK48]